MLIRSGMGVLAHLLFCGLLTFAETSDIALFLNEPAGRRIDPTQFSASEDSVRALPTKIRSHCPETPEKTCIPYVIQVPEGFNSELVVLGVTSGLELWENQSALAIDFQYQGVVTAEDLPYRKEAGAIVLDEFGNPILEGPMWISFSPMGQSFSGGSLSTQIQYSVPNFSQNIAEIVWAGVFINPEKVSELGCRTQCISLNGDRSFSLKSILSFEAGRMLGLLPSALSSSVMFPFQNFGSQKRFDALRADDLLRALSFYRAPSDTVERGSIEGQIIYGQDGSPQKGAVVYLIPKANVQSFSLSPSADLVTYSGLARQDGHYKFNLVPKGDYVVLVEALSNQGQLRANIFDEWTRFFSDGRNFSPDFYDGRGRESNLEPARYSPRSALVAATVHVRANQTTSNVNIITESDDRRVNKIDATGSTDESLSEFNFSDLTTVLDEAFNRESVAEATISRRASHGCELSNFTTTQGGIIWLIVFLLLCLSLRTRRVQKATQRPVVLP